MIVIVDYGMGNLGSIVNAFRKLNVPVAVSSDVKVIKSADKLVLPGVGSFDTGMKNLAERGLISILHEQVIEYKTPIIGFCLGMQLFAKQSEEGQLPGLGWVNGEVVRFKFGAEGVRLKIPHMGWNTVDVMRANPLIPHVQDEQRFYFVHSYYMVCDHDEDVLATVHHGYKVTAAINHDNIYGVQFHPEKSHRFGINLINNFVKL